MRARSILNSRGNPTVECDVKTNDGLFRASVPSGASTGIHEALELRDGKKEYLGLGVQQAIHNVNTIIAKKLIGKNPAQQKELDETLIKLDSTENKTKLGANAILAASMALCKAGAASQDEPLYSHIAHLFGTKKVTLPVPAFNIINGGKHAGNKLDIQEYMILPTRAKSFSEALRMGSEIYHTLKKQLENKYGKMATNVGDEGGFAPPFTCIEEPFDAIMDALITLGYTKQVKLGIDCAANSFWKHGTYVVEGKTASPDDLITLYEQLTQNYPLVSIEDPFYEEDYEHFAELKRTLPHTQIVGDDLLCTTVERMKKALHFGSCNALLLKINQIGTITEALNAAHLARQHSWNIMTSHRSGETEDTFIADLSVGISSGQIKSGAPARGERIAKYNQLLRIEEELDKKAVYAGKTLKFGHAQ